MLNETEMEQENVRLAAVVCTVESDELSVILFLFTEQAGNTSVVKISAFFCGFDCFT